MQPHIITLLITAILMACIASTHSPQIQIRLSKTHITGSTLKLSHLSKRQLEEFLHTNDSLMGVSISRVSLVENSHNMIYYASDNPAIRNLISTVHPKQYAFTTKQSETDNSNTMLLGIINGDIACQVLPSGEICHVAIPIAVDRSGDFVGYITIFIKPNLSMMEKRRIIQMTKRLASDLYIRDVLHRSGDIPFPKKEISDE